MAVPSASAKAKLSRMVAATVAPVLTDADLAAALVEYALADGGGLPPVNVLWVETYDWNGAAAVAWGWKAAAASATVTVNADGQLMSLSHVVANCLERQAHYERLRQTGTFHVGTG